MAGWRSRLKAEATARRSPRWLLWPGPSYCSKANGNPNHQTNYPKSDHSYNLSTEKENGDGRLNRMAQTATTSKIRPNCPVGAMCPEGAVCPHDDVTVLFGQEA
jgi:hypothetical protein